jgi:hypothetical protein
MRAVDVLPQMYLITPHLPYLLDELCVCNGHVTAWQPTPSIVALLGQG